MAPADTPLMVSCDSCHKPVASYGTIKLGTYDPTRRYKTSHRKMIMNYRWRLCEKHYKQALGAITKAIEGV